MAEKRLIDADSLLEKIDFRIDIQGLVGATVRDMVALTRKIITAEPTVDAVEVVHGYTIPAEEPKKVLLDRKCGICDQLMLSTDAFCPMCGAKMDGYMENNRQAEVIR